MNIMNTKNTKNEQLGSFLDNELPEQDIEIFIDSLLEKTPEGEKLVTQLKYFYLLSSLINNHNVEKDFIFEDRTRAISKQLESEPNYSTPPITQLEIKNIPSFFNLFKSMSIGSAIAASFGLIVANLFHTPSVHIPSVAETYAIKYDNSKKNSTDPLQIQQKNYISIKNQVDNTSPNITPVVNNLDSAKNINLINEMDEGRSKVNKKL
jgi:hypothetical protein